MYISRSIVDKHTAEIANLSYSITLDSGVSFKLKEGDLLFFIKHNIPSLDVTPYLEKATQHLKHVQAIDLLNFLRFKLDPVFIPYFCGQLYETSFDESDKTGYAFDCYTEMKEAGGFENFFEMAEKITSELGSGVRNSITREIDLNSKTWTFFDSSMVLNTPDGSLRLAERAIAQLSSHIEKDFKENGEQTLAYLGDFKTKYEKYVSVDDFLNNFDNDVAAFKASSMSYEELCKLLNKYNLPESI